MSDHGDKQALPFAVPSSRSRGRAHAEPPDPIRDPFELDRHRILSSAAFRRLECKTQVFVTYEHDHFRTRLTHTLEVVEVSRRLAVALEVNSTLAEAIALAHDLGHPPFGHAGEVTLRDLMRDHGGFEHNLHSLRIVDYLEHPYPPFRGLNLTFEVREGLAKHETAYDRPQAPSDQPDHDGLFAVGPWPTMEGQIASAADRLAYDCHDLEDALGAGLLDEPDLQSVALWTRCAEDVRRRHPDAPLAAVRRPILDALLNHLLLDVIDEARRRLAAHGPTSVDDVRQAPQPMLAFSTETDSLVGQFESFLFERVYRHPRLVRMDAKARRLIERLFAAYLDSPKMLPKRFADRIDEQGVHRVVCDYVGGMTDRFCQDDCKRLFEPFERV